MSAAVFPERCPECGASFSVELPRHWTPIAILEACREWARVHGEFPKADQWMRGGPHNPTKHTVVQAFGSWGAMIAAAGYEPRRAGVKVWTKERIIEGFRLWREHHGRWPTQREWSTATAEHPHYHTVRTEFGSWNAGRRAAGYKHRGRATIKTLAQRGEHGKKIGRVTATPIADLLRRELAIRPLETLAEELSFDASYLSRIAQGKTATVRTDHADLILTKLDHPHLLDAARIAA